MSATALALPRDRFIGREADLARLCRLLTRTEVGLVTLTGPAGVGKTRLALELAAALGQTGATPPVTIVDLVEAEEPSAVPHVVFRAFGLFEMAAGDLEERLVETINLRPGLLVLDNFEHVLDAAPFAARLMARCRSLKVVATSRAALRLRGEWLYDVRPLSLPEHEAEVRPERPGAALRLFAARAAAAKPGFRLTQENAPAVGAICSHLDGIPLAIEFAAARVAFSTPAEVLADLEQGLSSLGQGPRDLPARQRTLSDAIAWSYGLLEGRDQQLIAALGVLVGSFTVDAAAAVADRDPRDARAGIERLCALGLLVQARAIAGVARWRLLETVRSFALDALSTEGREREARLRYVGWLAGLAQGFEPGVHSPDAGRWLDRLEAEVPALRTCLASFTPPEGRSAVMRILAASSRFWFLRGRAAEGAELFEPTIRAAQQCPATDEARAFYSYFFIKSLAFDVTPDDFALLDVAVDLASAAGDDSMLAVALSQRAYTTFASGPLGFDDRIANAVPDMQRALALAERSGDQFTLMAVLRYAGHLWPAFSTQAEGKQQLQRCIDIARHVGSPSFLAFAGTDLGIVALEQGNPEEALKHARQAVEAAESVGQELGIWYAEEVLAQATHAMGDAKTALEHQARAVLSFLRGGQCGPFILRGLLHAASMAHAAGLPGLATRTLGVLGSYAQVLDGDAAGAGQQRPGWANDEMGHKFQLDDLQREAADLDRQHRLTERYPAEREDGGRSSPREWAELVLGVAFQAKKARPAAGTSSLQLGLTGREVELLRLVTRGLRNEEIASELVISVKTVERHLSNLYAKLGVRGRADAVAYAMRSGAGTSNAPLSRGAQAWGEQRENPQFPKQNRSTGFP